MAISVRQVSKNFGKHSVLDQLSLEVNPGQLVSLLGPSGCGKTTLLRIIAGLERADRGHIFFGGVDTANWDFQQRKVGFVFQNYALFRHMTVAENISFGLRMRARKERPDKAALERRVSELLQLVQLEAYGERYPHQLSGGQRQRVALARALAIDPQILLLDEPFGALDAKVRRDLRSWLRDLQQKLGITAILVTHDQEEAMAISDHIVLLNQGRIEQQGTPAELFQNPATPFALSFLS
jgi:sulfate transport system ATP-binding protein